MAIKNVAPSVLETAFNCPHCYALAKQFWFSLVAFEHSEKSALPNIIDHDRLNSFDFEQIEDVDERQKVRQWAEAMAKGAPFLSKEESRNKYGGQDLHNTHLSQCYNCGSVSIWIFDKLVYPPCGAAEPANPDLPEDIRLDYEEASSILKLSPRGAAALIRLGIQKLCKELGQSGENINADIAGLVEGGLDQRVQKALDAVRVIGNNAVHPGQIDLRDDMATAESLFRLMNLIVEKMISEPRQIDEVYSKLPEDSRRAIEARDSKS